MLMGNLLLLKSDGQAVCMMHVFLQIVMFRKVTPELLPDHEGVPQLLLGDPAYPLLLCHERV